MFDMDRTAKLKELEARIVAGLSAELQAYLAQQHRIAEQVKRLQDQTCGR